MHFREHNQRSSLFTQKREALEQAYWHARTAQNRPDLPASTRRRWRDHAERAAASLRDMGVFVEG